MIANRTDGLDAAGMAVKALEWQTPFNSTTLTRADTFFGIYRVYTYHEANGRWFWSLDGYEKASGEVVSEEAGHATCQLDYATRIRSALVDAPAGEVREIWQQLLEKDDRTSPAEYPDMALITFEEFAALASPTPSVAALQVENEGLRDALAPFVKAAEARAQLVLGEDIDHWPIVGDDITLGDIRRAAIASKKPTTTDTNR